MTIRIPDDGGFRAVYRRDYIYSVRLRALHLYVAVSQLVSKRI